MKLVIVESPAKCKKIAGFLGKDYQCVATVGHIYEIDNGLEGIDPTTWLPTYRKMKKKTKVLANIRSLAKKAEEVFLATDPDREGEAIAYHICLFLSLPVATTKRVRFHEITQKAVCDAVQHPSCLDMSLVRAQQARQVLDLYFGYTLSPFLWKMIGPRLSAGRCQSPALGMLVEREQKLVEPVSRMVVKWTFDHGLQKCILQQPRLETKQQCTDMIDSLKSINTYTIDEKKITKHTQSPPAPFITSTIQQNSGFSPGHCMKILQSLYEKGKITYIRTDSPSLSEFALDACRDYITNTFGISMHHRRVFTSKSSNSQEAHEAIRPTDPHLKSLDSHVFSTEERRLYGLVWKRTMASQMANHRYNEQEIQITCDIYSFLHKSRQILDMGWKCLYETQPQDMLVFDPQVKRVLFVEGEITQEFESSLGRHSESTLVRSLESNGIGRPSTFANICSKILERRYAIIQDIRGKEIKRMRMSVARDYVTQETQEKYVLGAEKKKWVVTDLGQRVVQVLQNIVPLIMDYNFTKTMETDLDIILQDPAQYTSIIEKHVRRIEACIHESD